MSVPWVYVRVPATTANLGPGFDALALALDLWNEVWVRPTHDRPSIEVYGEGRDLPVEANRMLQAMALFYQQVLGSPLPPLQVVQRNAIPLGSGLGSSAAATLSGLLAASALAEKTLPPETLLALAADLEGHADNAAAALLGGLVVVLHQADGLRTYRFSPARLRAVVITPRFNLPTAEARALLPRQVSLSQAVYNLGRTALVLQALIQGDLALLCQAMDDQLHQPHRLPLIPGAVQAMEAARRIGAAVALSGAGPSLVAFVAEREQAVAEVMLAAFQDAGLLAQARYLTPTLEGATWRWVDNLTI